MDNLFCIRIACIFILTKLTDIDLNTMYLFS